MRSTTKAVVVDVEDAVAAAVLALGADRAAALVRDVTCAAGCGAYSAGERREAVRRLRQRAKGGAR